MIIIVIIIKYFLEDNKKIFQYHCQIFFFYCFLKSGFMNKATNKTQEAAEPELVS